MVEQEMESIATEEVKPLKSFFKLSDLFFGNFLKKSKVRSSDRDLIKKVDQFITLKEFWVVYDMVESGYQLNSSQQKKVQSHIEELLLMYPDGSGGNILADKFLNTGLSLSDNTKMMYFFNLVTGSDVIHPMNFFLDKQETMEFILNTYDQESNERLSSVTCKVPALTKELRNFIHTSEFFPNVVTMLTVDLFRGNDEVKLRANRKLVNILTGPYKSEFLAHLSFDKFVDLATQVENKYPDGMGELKHVLKNIIKDDYTNGIAELLNKTKKIHGAEYLEQITTKTIADLTPGMKINKLPQAAQGLIEEINILYGNIQGKDDFDTTNLFEKRIPEILTKYLTIDKAYQTTLRNNQGKNAADLMLDSLTNIRDNFQKKWQVINENALSSLSATNKYTKQFK